MTKTPSPALWQQLKETHECLQRVLEGASTSEILLNVPSELRPATQALLFLTLRRLGTAKGLVKLLAKKAPKEPAQSLLCVVLAIGSVDVDPMYSDFTLVSQAVEVAKRNPLMKAQAPFINGCLRNFLRERIGILASLENDPQSIWNHPLWWINLLKKQYPNHWGDILKANNELPPLSMRVNRLRSTRAELSRSWTEKGINHTLQGEQGLIIQSPIAVHLIPGFDEGLCTVQDGGAQMAAQLLMQGIGVQFETLVEDGGPTKKAQKVGPPSLVRILDACSAPGGKTTHLLEYPNVQVTALDIDPARCKKVHESCERMGVQAQVVCADAADLDSWWDKELFDAVLLDAPGTASGIVRRHPDIRWLRRESDIAQLGEMQKRLLDKTWQVLKIGGKLLFCTCSVFKQEGEQQVQSFLRRNTDASICTQVGHLLPTLTSKGELLKDNELIDHDGFFYTLLQKN